MTKEKREQLSNRLVMNFGVLLVAALLMLYVNSAIKSTFAKQTYVVLLVFAIIGAVGAAFLFIWGLIKKSKAKNYSAIFLGIFIASTIVYLSNFSLFAFYTKSFAVVTVYIAIFVYFIIMSIYTSIMMRKPLAKDPVAEAKSRAIKKKKKKK